MKTPRLIDGEWVIKKTMTLPVHIYQKFEEEMDELGLTPSELITSVLSARYESDQSP